MSSADPLRFFGLKPIQAARVSEISETTAAASVPGEEQINFHIGNPLQDGRLSSTFMRIALGIDVNRQELQDSSVDVVLEYLGWDKREKPRLELLIQLIRNSIPYMPRGGYIRTNPNALIRRFRTWLEQQQEPLHYDLGDKSGRREVILASGGIAEALRVVLFALSDYLKVTPARVLCHRTIIPLSESSFPNLQFTQLADDERPAIDQVEQLASQKPQTPTFMILGSLLGEEARRKLRSISTEAALFFIEANNTHNHQSLAREAKLVQRVIRLLSPAIFSDRLASLSPVFVAGNADFLRVIENVHFKLKGTPSASEVQLLSFLLENNLPSVQTDSHVEADQQPTRIGGYGFLSSSENSLFDLSIRVGNRLERTINANSKRVNSILTTLDEKLSTAGNILADRYPASLMDKLADVDSRDLLEQLVENCYDPAWQQALMESFLCVFLQHQPQYQPEKCMIVSGSSRTALGILGFNCGITDVVISDLSWSYEQCFPKVHVVPLLDSLALDVDGLIAKIQQLCQDDPLWPAHGALVINNPHNATGRVFDEISLRRLIAYCLEHKIYVIDDLAYQNVAPAPCMVEIKTVRQISTELVRSGKVPSKTVDRVVTVHAMSKTDCLAGARMAVAEILDDELRLRFQRVNSAISPNLAAIFICYLFYRGSIDATRAYWGLRNKLFQERSQALMAAMENLPANRNPFGLEILPPAGSMYPLLLIKNLPAGLSLDWLASSLARRGIGLLPLATFARTEKGFETGRRAFRLTLGGPDPAEVLLAKTRRLLIDLNRIIAEEQAHFNRKRLGNSRHFALPGISAERSLLWENAVRQINDQLSSRRLFTRLKAFQDIGEEHFRNTFLAEYLPERLEVFHTRLVDRAGLSDELARRAMTDSHSWLEYRLDREFMKDSIQKRQESFRLRNYDRTVHPTQRYSLRAEIAFDALLESIIAGRAPAGNQVEKAALELLDEFLGRTVPISSRNEADEILLDFKALVAAEDYSEMFSGSPFTPFLSFWSDWDGSNRPSGQGHCLVGALVMENVRQMAGILNSIRQVAPQTNLPADLLAELEGLPERSARFSQLLNNITFLTQQLEQRYRGILPMSVETNRFERLVTQLHLRRDPVRVLWQHNDRYEQKMLDLRRQRRDMLESYFALNKRIRKQLHALIPAIEEHVNVAPLQRQVVGYHDLLQRTVITPRIHQATITARDQFAIDTTVYNIQEINTLTGKYGNPGMTLGLQISFSSKPEALISLDRKLSVQAEKASRNNPTLALPAVWLIPLFEDSEIVKEIPGFLDKVWDYGMQSRRADQSPQSRFAEILPEIFIAGSDLSQQVSQAHGAYQYLKAKHTIYNWLAEHGVAESVRIKLGSGEAMQRQGGYYSQEAGQAAFPSYHDHKQRFVKFLPEAAQKSTAYAVTPLQGIYLGGDLRTFQSCLSEQLRYLPVGEYANLLFHVRQTQAEYRRELIRAVETITESRLGTQSRNVRELERLTIGANDPIYDGFMQELTRHFRHILYGHDEDVVGIHVISYFVARSMPQLRDRPTSRPRLAVGADRGQQILASIADVIPFAKHGSLLRAIAHNQAQTGILGVNQLTTGLFRALDYYSQSTLSGAENENSIAERILPNLPVYEILHTLRLYQDHSTRFITKIEKAFPAGNSAFVALREDMDAMQRYLPLFQKELLRRHGLDAGDFFPEGIFIQELLPALRPDLAVLLQKDLFNRNAEHMMENVSGRLDQKWQKQVAHLLRLPEQIDYWRSLVWDVIGESLYQRVQSFTELAGALYSFSAVRSFGLPVAPANRPKLSTALADFLRTSPVDDEMRQFLVSAVEYLNSFSASAIEIPVSIIRAMNDVERIAMIEETSLTPEQQEVLRFAALQIARLAGDNG